MLLSLIFYLNSLGNFVLQIVLGGLLSPAEYGRYATVSLAALTLAAATLDWLKVSALRFSEPSNVNEYVGASLELAYLAVVSALLLGAGASYAFGLRFGLSSALVALTPLLAISFNRVDFDGARFRARDQERQFRILYGLRQVFYFTVVVGSAYVWRDATIVVIAMALASFAAVAIVKGLVPGSPVRLGDATRDDLRRFLAYGKPVVISLMLYQLIYLANRTYALHVLGGSAAGNLSLATDVGSRLFIAVNALPEFLLFQFVLKREREQGAVAAIRLLETNAALVFALMIGLAAGYIGMANTFTALIVPAAFHGDFASLSVALAPGFLALCLIISAIHPVFQLAGRTLPIALAGASAVITDIVLLWVMPGADTLIGLARINSASFLVALAVATAAAFVVSPARPRLRDLGVTTLAAIALCASLLRLDTLPSHALAAALALVVGSGFYASVLLAFDVGDIRSRVTAALKSKVPLGLGAVAE